MSRGGLREGASTPAEYKAERIKRRLSQAALAKEVDVSRATINGREAGRDRFPITREAWLALCSLPLRKTKDSRKGTNACGSGDGER